VLQDPLDHQVSLDRQDHQEHQEQGDHQEHLALMELLVHLVVLDNLVQRDLVDRQDLLGKQEEQVLPVPLAPPRAQQHMLLKRAIL
jgi:hypothetical protein